MHNVVDFAIVTALSKECQAVVNRFDTPPYTVIGKKDNKTYHRGQIKLDTGEFYEVVAVCLTRVGNVDAAITTSDIVNAYNPKYLILVGIAGGITQEDLEVGDVVIANQVFQYDYNKETPAGLESRPEVYRCSHLLLERVRNFWSDEWIKKINVPRPKKTGRGQPKRCVNPIATGNKVIANKKFHKQILVHHSKIHATDMEAGGFMHALDSKSPPVGGLIIRGISDMAGKEKDNSWQEYASNAAAAYAVEFLKSRPVEPLSPSKISTEIPKFDQHIKLPVDLNKIISWNVARQLAQARGNLKRNATRKQIKKVLVALGLLRKVTKERRLRLTNAGLLLICKRPDIQLSRSMVCADVYSSLDTSTLVHSQNFVGPLPQVVDQACAFFQKHIKKRMLLVNRKRLEVTEYPMSALREALVNAVAHRDYNLRWKNIYIAMFPNRIVISNPGRLLEPLKLKHIRSLKYRPFSRNLPLVHALSLLGYMEERGSGIKRMCQSCIECGLKPPAFKHNGDYFEVTFYAPGYRK